MCEYTDMGNGRCRLTKDVCPYLYFCNKTQSYRPLRSMPMSCKIEENFNVPKGAYKVCFERRNKLYIEVEGSIVILDNPFNEAPAYVKMTKLKNGKWKIKQAVG